MRTTINTIHVEISKEEMIATIYELKSILGPAASGETEKFPMVRKLEKVLTDSFKVGEISGESTSFKLTPQ